MTSLLSNHIIVKKLDGPRQCCDVVCTHEGAHMFYMAQAAPGKVGLKYFPLAGMASFGFSSRETQRYHCNLVFTWELPEIGVMNHQDINLT